MTSAPTCHALRHRVGVVGYQTAYSQLAFAGKKEADPCKDIPDAKLYLAKSLQTFNQAHPGKVGP